MQELNATWRRWQKNGDVMNVSDVEIQCAELQMLSRTDHGRDTDVVLEWARQVLG